MVISNFSQKKCTKDTCKMFTANLQIHPQDTFLELYFGVHMMCLFFRISGTLYQMAMLKSCTYVYTYQQCMSMWSPHTLISSDCSCNLYQFSKPKLASDFYLHFFHCNLIWIFFVFIDHLLFSVYVFMLFVPFSRTCFYSYFL